MASNTDDMTECPVCFEDYASTGDHVPLLLPCSHTICKKCKESIMLRNPVRNLVCPFDKRVFPKNYVVPENRYILAGLGREPSGVRAEQGESRGSRETVWTKCPRHSSRNLNNYCVECGSSICDLCMNRDHVGHDVVDINDQVVMKAKELQSKVKEVKNEIRKVKDKRETTRKAVEKITEASLSEVGQVEKMVQTYAQEIKEEIIMQRSASRNQLLEVDQTLDELLATCESLSDPNLALSLSDVESQEGIVSRVRVRLDVLRRSKEVVCTEYTFNMDAIPEAQNTLANLLQQNRRTISLGGEHHAPLPQGSKWTPRPEKPKTAPAAKPTQGNARPTGEALSTCGGSRDVVTCLC